MTADATPRILLSMAQEDVDVQSVEMFKIWCACGRANTVSASVTRSVPAHQVNDFHSSHEIFHVAPYFQESEYTDFHMFASDTVMLSPRKEYEQSKSKLHRHLRARSSLREKAP